MALPIFLPPLNSHENFSLYVNIREYKTSDNFRNLNFNDDQFERRLFIRLHVYVDFYSENDNNMETMFPGLDIVATKQINVKTPEALQTSLRERILDEDLIPFPLHDCFWTEQHLHGCPMGLQLSDEDELVDRIFDFVRLVDEKPENDDLKLVPVTMEIRKIVVVSEEEFGSWVSWYDEQKRVDPNFRSKYRRSINRPRTRNEVSQEAESLMARRPADIGTGELDTVIVNSDEGGRGCGGGSSAWLKEPCSICLEEFSDGVHGTRLPCRHMFHENCILRWLRRNHVCPLCRYQLPV